MTLLEEKRGNIPNYVSFFPAQQIHFLLTTGRKSEQKLSEMLRLKVHTSRKDYF